MKNNLFIVRSPLQVLSAIEASLYFKTSNNILMIIHNRKQSKKSIHIKNTVNAFSHNLWSEIIEVNERKESKFIEVAKLMHQLKNKAFDKIFIGDSGSVQFSIAATFKATEVFHIDDGTGTIVNQENGTYIKKNKPPLSKRLRNLRYNILGFKTEPQRPINLFTIFNINAIGKQLVIKHQFESLKKNLLTLKNTTDDIFFIGQPLVENGVISKSYFYETMKKISTKFKNKNIFYCKHRSESSEKLKQLSMFDRFKVVTFDGPLEIELLKQEQISKTFLSFNSAALYTISLLYTDIDCLYLKIDQQDYTKEKFEKNFNFIYKLFETSSQLTRLKL